MNEWLLTDTELEQLMLQLNAEVISKRITALEVPTRIAKAQARKIMKQQNQLCKEHPWDIEKKFYRLRKDCPDCIEQLKKDVGL